MEGQAPQTPDLTQFIPRDGGRSPDTIHPSRSGPPPSHDRGRDHLTTGAGPPALRRQGWTGFYLRILSRSPPSHQSVPQAAAREGRKEEYRLYALPRGPVTKATVPPGRGGAVTGRRSPHGTNRPSACRFNRPPWVVAGRSAHEFGAGCSVEPAPAPKCRSGTCPSPSFVWARSRPSP